ncbi:MAG: flagellar basal body-associated FliL family protein [Parvibaculaceae bacterium]
MAEEAKAEAAPPEAKSGSLVLTAAALTVLTLLAGGAGAGIGLQLYSKVDEAAKQRAATQKATADPAYTAGMKLKALPPIITSLASSKTWVRIEASIVFQDELPEDADVVAAQIAEDTLAYVRTVTLPQLEGASGLLHLRDDLNERASIRSGGRVREFIIQTLAVE